MTVQRQEVVSFLRHLGSESSPFQVRRTAPAPQWADQTQHETAYRYDPELYGLCSVADKVRPEQQARCLFQLLARSRQNLPTETRQLLDRVAAHLLATLEPEQVLTVFKQIQW